MHAQLEEAERNLQQRQGELLSIDAQVSALSGDVAKGEGARWVSGYLCPVIEEVRM
jgi:hypothetical protein